MTVGLDDLVSDVAGSVWGWVSELPGEAVRTVRGVGEAAFAPISLAYDMSNTLTDPQNVQSFAEVLRDRGKARFFEAMEDLLGADSGLGAVFSSVPEPLRAPVRGVAMPALDWADRVAEVAREGIATGFLATEVAGNELGQLFDRKTWEQARQLSETVSIGQAFAFMAMPDVDASNPEHRKKVNSPWFDIVSGSFDFAAQMGIDPLVLVGGPLAKGARAVTRPVISNAADMARFFSEAPSARAAAVRSHWTYVNDTVERVKDVAAERVASRLRERAVENIEKEGKRVRAAEQKLLEVIESDPALQEWTQAIYDRYGMTTVQWTEHIDNAQKTLREGGRWEDLPQSFRDIMEPQIELWMGSSTNVDLHDARTLRAIIGEEASTMGALYRGFRARGSDMQWRGEIAAERGGRQFRMNPADELVVGEEFDVGAWSFSESQNTAENFGRDTIFVIEDGKDRWSFGIPESVEARLRMTEQEHLVSGRYKVTRIEKPTMNVVDPSDPWAALYRNSLESDTYYYTQVLDEVYDQLSDAAKAKWDDLTVRADELEPQTLYDEFTEILNQESDLGIPGMELDLQLPRTIIGMDTVYFIPKADGTIGTYLREGGPPKVYLERSGQPANFSPKNLKTLTRLERKVIEARTKMQKAEDEYRVSDPRPESAGQLINEREPWLLRQEEGRLQAQLLRSQKVLELTQKFEAQTGTVYGAGLHLTDDFRFDFDSFIRGVPEDRAAFLQELRRAVDSSTQHTKSASNRSFSRDEWREFIDNTKAAIDEIERRTEGIDDFNLGHPIRNKLEPVVEQLAEWFDTQRNPNIANDALQRAKERRQRIYREINEIAKRQKNGELSTMETYEAINRAMEDINDEIPSYATNPFLGTNLRIGNEKLAKMYEAGIQRAQDSDQQLFAANLQYGAEINIPPLRSVEEVLAADEFVRPSYGAINEWIDSLGRDHISVPYTALEDVAHNLNQMYNNLDIARQTQGAQYVEAARDYLARLDASIAGISDKDLVRKIRDTLDNGFEGTTKGVNAVNVPVTPIDLAKPDPEIASVRAERQKLLDEIEVREAQVLALQKRQREIKRVVTDESVREIAARVFPGDPWGATKARLLAMAPDAESRQWVMRVLTGDSTAMKDLDSLAKELSDRQRIAEAARAEVRAMQEGNLLPEDGQLAIDFDLERADRIARLRNELETISISEGVHNRFFGVLDKQLSDAVVYSDLLKPGHAEAILRDVARNFDLIHELEDLAGLSERLPKITRTGDVRAAGRQLGSRIRRSRFYRESHIGGKAVRIAMAPFDERAFPTINYNDAPSATRTMGAMLRQAGMDEGSISKWQSAVASETMSASQRSVEFEKAIRAAYENIGREFDIPSDVFNEVIEKAQAGRKRREVRLQEQRFAGKKEGAEHARDEWPTENGLDYTVYPLLQEQTVNSGLIPDFTMLRNDLRRWQSKGFSPSTAEWRQMTSAQARYIADFLNSAVKLNLVLRPSWMLRVFAFDEGLRPLAIFGLAATKQWPRALNRLRARYAEKADGVFHRLGVDPNSKARKVAGMGLSAATGALVAGPVGAIAGAAASGGMRFLRRLDDLAKHGYDEAAVSTRFGDFTFDGISQGKGEILSKSLSQRDALSELISEETSMRDLIARNTGNWRTLVPTDKNHVGSWVHILNKQYGQNAVVQRLHRGESVDDIVAWIEGPEGQSLREALPVPTADPYDYVERIKAEWEDLTVASPSIADAAVKNSVTKKQLEQVPVAERPNINGPEIAYSMGTGIGQTMQKLVDGLIDNLGEVPADELSRQPMFDMWYRRELKRLTELRGEQGRLLDEHGLITPEVKRAIEEQALKSAFQKTKGLLYEFAAKNEFHRMVRFISPFFSAAQEGWSTWATIAWDHPLSVVYASKLWNKATQSDYYEEDENGRGFFYLPIPSAAKGLLEDGMFSGIASQGEVAIPLSSFNLILDGNVLSGPVMRVSAGALARNMPEMESMLEPFIPYGAPDDNVDAFLGGLPSAVRDWYQKEGSDAYLGTYLGVLQTYIADVHHHKRDYNLDDIEERRVFLEDVKEAADSLFKFRIATTALSPVTVIPQSPYRYYIEQAREMKSRNPENWFEEFYDTFGPEYVAVANGLTRTRNGVPPTQHGYRQYQEFQSLIEEHPEWGAFIVGDDPANDELTKFSSAVYDWQASQSVAPGSREKQREFKSAEEALDEPDIRIGWHEYVKGMDYLDMQLAGRGLVSYQQKGAEDLLQEKQGMTRFLADKYPAWWEEFNKTDRLKFERTLQGAKDIVANEKMSGRADVKALKDYLEVREYFLGLVAERGAAKSLTAVANQDLYNEYIQTIQYLSATDPAFGPVYYRYFERDPMEVGDAG